MLLATAQETGWI